MSLHSEMLKSEDSGTILILGKAIAKEAGNTCKTSVEGYAAGYIAGMLALRNAKCNKTDREK